MLFVGKTDLHLIKNLFFSPLKTEIKLALNAEITVKTDCHDLKKKFKTG